MEKKEERLELSPEELHKRAERFKKLRSEAQAKARANNPPSSFRKALKDFERKGSSDV